MDDRDRFRALVIVIGAVWLGLSFRTLWMCFGHPWPSPEERFFGAGLGLPRLVGGLCLIGCASRVARFGYPSHSPIEGAGNEPSRPPPCDRAGLSTRVLGLAVTLRGVWGLWTLALVHLARIDTLKDVSDIWQLGVDVVTLVVGIYALRGAPGLVRAYARVRAGRRTRGIGIGGCVARAGREAPRA